MSPRPLLPLTVADLDALTKSSQDEHKDGFPTEGRTVFGVGEEPKGITFRVARARDMETCLTPAVGDYLSNRYMFCDGGFHSVLPVRTASFSYIASYSDRMCKSLSSSSSFSGNSLLSFSSSAPDLFSFPLLFFFYFSSSLPLLFFFFFYLCFHVLIQFFIVLFISFDLSILNAVKPYRVSDQFWVALGQCVLKAQAYDDGALWGSLPPGFATPSGVCAKDPVTQNAENLSAWGVLTLQLLWDKYHDATLRERMSPQDRSVIDRILAGVAHAGDATRDLWARAKGILSHGGELAQNMKNMIAGRRDGGRTVGGHLVGALLRVAQGMPPPRTVAHAPPILMLLILMSQRYRMPRGRRRAAGRRLSQHSTTRSRRYGRVPRPSHHDQIGSPGL